MIRRATLDDARALADVGAATFIESFGHLYVPADLQAFLAESHSVAAYAAALSNPEYALWVAEREACPGQGRTGAVIGYAQAGACGLPHEDVRGGDGELKRLYLLKSEHNGGIGAALLDQSLAWLERDGPRTLWISVWSENFGAQRFYGRRGFRFAGEYDFMVGQQRDREFMYRRAPGAA